LSQIMDNSIKYNINSNSSKFFHIQKPRKCWNHICGVKEHKLWKIFWGT
jgi:hypothetical protein